MLFNKRIIGLDDCELVSTAECGMANSTDPRSFWKTRSKNDFVLTVSTIFGTEFLT